MAVTFKVEYKPTPVLDRLIASLGPEDRKKLDKAGAKSVVRNVHRYLRDLSGSRHKTANELGAAPTNVIGRTAAVVHAEEREDGCYVVVPHPLFRRAFRDVEIAPRTARALAIPVNKASYGKPPRSMSGLFIWSRRRKDGPADKGSAFLARSVGRGKTKRLELLYLLYRGRVLQRQDPTLLPSAGETGAAAMQGITRLLNSKLRSVKAKGAS